jgi:hypothetical protein
LLILRIKRTDKKAATTTERTDPAKIPIFAEAINFSEVKAKSEIKIAMVKPIPAKNPINTMCLKKIPLGRDHPNLLKINVARNIPNGFPIKSPKAIPRTKGLKNFPRISTAKVQPSMPKLEKEIPALNKINKGITK